MIKTYNIKDTKELLSLIEKSPGVVLRERRLDLFYAFISGYQMLGHSVKDQLSNFGLLKEFEAYLIEKYEADNPNPPNWFAILSERFGEAEEGLDEFFKHYRQFIEADNPPHQ